MNIERLTYIAEWLENGGGQKGDVKQFHMPSWIALDIISNECGSTCCIGGAACIFFGERGPSALDERYWMTADDAQGLLNLDDDTADQLFFPGNDLNQIDEAWAARCIRNLIQTGKVDWESTRLVKEAA